ncbi:hypothetical protein FUT28_13760 [Enterococcus durans]|uniref:hypothetical protein n=1 Tax=Enterococcus durans TaxID=53345 RepID=UPI0011BD5C17|nr:hypothetical protein [Enterococcus durans]QED60759.1 hypothetical protein FS851_13775 [Enterococcus durans]QED63354.1 hypothetical protein FUT28_13760 [Enterococcus durans]
MSKLYLNKEQKKSARNRLLYLLNKYPFPLWENTPDVKAEIIQLRILLGLSTMDKSKPLKKIHLLILILILTKYYLSRDIVRHIYNKPLH